MPGPRAGSPFTVNARVHTMPRAQNRTAKKGSILKHFAHLVRLFIYALDNSRTLDAQFYSGIAWNKT